jgi:hypothetical protein
MTRDLRSALAEAAPVRSFPDVDRIWRRSRRLVWRRRLVRLTSTSMVVVVALFVWQQSNLYPIPVPQTPSRPEPPGVGPDPLTRPAQLFEDWRPLIPGTWLSSVSSVEISIRIPEPETFVDRTYNRWYAYAARPDEMDVGLAGTWSPRIGEFDIAVLPLDRLTGPGTGGSEAIRSDPTAWLRSLPTVHVGTKVAASLGGMDGALVQVAVGNVPGSDGIELGTSGFSFAEHSTAHVYVLEAGDRTIVTIVRSPTQDFSWFLHRAQPVLDSIRFDPPGP